MTLLEILIAYQNCLFSHCRSEADTLLQDIAPRELHKHIRACFDDSGNPLKAMGYNVKVVV